MPILIYDRTMLKVLHLMKKEADAAVIKIPSYFEKKNESQAKTLVQTNNHKI